MSDGFDFSGHKPDFFLDSHRGIVEDPHHNWASDFHHRQHQHHMRPSFDTGFGAHHHTHHQTGFDFSHHQHDVSFDFGAASHHHPAPDPHVHGGFQSHWNHDFSLDIGPAHGFGAQGHGMSHDLTHAGAVTVHTFSETEAGVHFGRAGHEVTLDEYFANDRALYNQHMNDRAFNEVFKPLAGVFLFKSVVPGVAAGLTAGGSLALQNTALSAEGAAAYYGAEKFGTGFIASKLTYETLLKLGAELGFRRAVGLGVSTVVGEYLDPAAQE